VYDLIGSIRWAIGCSQMLIGQFPASNRDGPNSAVLSKCGHDQLPSQICTHWKLTHRERATACNHSMQKVLPRARSSSFRKSGCFSPKSKKSSGSPTHISHWTSSNSISSGIIWRGSGCKSKYGCFSDRTSPFLYGATLQAELLFLWFTG
jgi:hypothetical protein